MVTKKNHFLAAIALLLAITGLTSCLKNDTQPQKPYFYMAVINAAPVPYALDAYINNTKTGGNIVFNSGMLLTPEPGTINLSFKAYNKDSVVATEITPYDTLKYYTHLIYGNAPISMYVIDETNNFTNDLSANQAHVRFYNLSPNTGSVDVYINDTKVYSARTYEDFVYTDSFNQLSHLNTGTVKLTVKAAGTDTVIATKENVTLNNGIIYTMFLSGLSGSTDTLKPAINILSHT